MRLRDWRVIVLAMACGGVGFLLATLLSDTAWHYAPNWGDIPTWLAVIVATVGGGIALSQLRQQQRVIEGEIDRNRKRDKLLDGQLRELTDMERSRQREQSEAVDVTWNDSPSPPGTSFVTVINGSRRPIRELTCLVYPDDLETSVTPDYAAEMNPIHYPQEAWVLPPKPQTPRPITDLPSLRSQGRAGFIFPVQRIAHPAGVARVEFRDDAGRHWRLYDDLSLSRITGNEN